MELLVLILAVGVAGWFTYKWFESRPGAVDQKLRVTPNLPPNVGAWGGYEDPEHEAAFVAAQLYQGVKLNTPKKKAAPKRQATKKKVAKKPAAKKPAPKKTASKPKKGARTPVRRRSSR